MCRPGCAHHLPGLSTHRRPCTTNCWVDGLVTRISAKTSVSSSLTAYVRIFNTEPLSSTLLWRVENRMPPTTAANENQGEKTDSGTVFVHLRLQDTEDLPHAGMRLLDLRPIEVVRLESDLSLVAIVAERLKDPRPIQLLLRVQADYVPSSGRSKHALAGRSL